MRIDSNGALTLAAFIRSALAAIADSCDQSLKSTHKGRMFEHVGEYLDKFILVICFIISLSNTVLNVVIKLVIQMPEPWT
jgi:hypothetical protein